MTVTFRYFFDGFFVMRLVEGVFLFLVYLMLLLFSRVKNQDRRDPDLLKNAGIIGMVIVSIKTALPSLLCSSPITGLCYTLGFLIGLISYIPVLVSLGILQFLFANLNQEIYGRYLYYSGLFWIVNFMGSFLSLWLSIFQIQMFDISIILTFFWIPALILMIVHGTKFGDSYYISAGVFYILFWLTSIIFSYFLPF